MSGKHASKSPSKAERLHKCPGSNAYIAHVEELGGLLWDGPIEAASLGNAAHLLLETCLAENTEPRAYAGRMILVDDRHVQFINRPRKSLPEGTFVFEVDLAMMDGVSQALEYVEARVVELGIGREDILLEGRTNPLPDREDTSGIADITLDAWPKVLEVVDYKNGRYYVDELDNVQVLCYLLGRAQETNFSHDSYRMTIVQPNAPGSDAEGGGRVRSVDVSLGKLKLFEQLHRFACEQADKAEEDFTNRNLDEWANDWLEAGDHCGLCRAKAVCPIYTRHMQREAHLKFGDLPDFDSIEHERLFDLVRKAEGIRAFLSACEAIVFKMVREHGDKTPEDIRVGRKRGNRYLRDDIPIKKLLDAMVQSGYFNKNELAMLYEPEKLISGPQMEKLVDPKKRKQFEADFLMRKEGREYLYVKRD